MIDGLDTVVAGAVLGSAILHAGWNALAKAIPHRLLASTLMGTVYLAGGAAWCAIAPFPAAASWPYLATSAVLQTGYLLLLTAAYSQGEFGRIYPMARGTAPLLVTIFSLTVLGERLRPGQLAGIALVVAALAGLVLLRGRPLRGEGVGLAALTGIVIAAYSLVDGLGVRHSGSAAGYAAWLFAVQGPLLVGTSLALAGPRRLIGMLRSPGDRAAPAAASPRLRSARHRERLIVAAGVAGGLLSLAAYAIVLWAQSRASLSLVSALRETSVLFAGLIGTLVFRERFSGRQTFAAVTVLAGIVLIQVG